MQTAESAPDLRLKPAIAPVLRRAMNHELRPKNAVASIYPPTPHDPGKLYEQKPGLTVVRLPRGNAGRQPRGGVFIPLPAIARVRYEKASRHRKQKAKDGCFGSKRAKLTLWFKLLLLWHGFLQSIDVATARRERRAQLGRATA